MKRIFLFTTLAMLLFISCGGGPTEIVTETAIETTAVEVIENNNQKEETEIVNEEGLEEEKNIEINGCEQKIQKFEKFVDSLYTARENMSNGAEELKKFANLVKQARYEVLDVEECIKHDNYKSRIQDAIRKCEKITGVYERANKTNTSSSQSTRNSDYSSKNKRVSFNSSSDVMLYLSQHRFSSNGVTISIRYDGIYSNGQAITSAVSVERFSGMIAVLSASSPYAGGAKLYFVLDASRGTITDESGDVFYIK